jgi:hypothetical protein
MPVDSVGDSDADVPKGVRAQTCTLGTHLRRLVVLAPALPLFAALGFACASPTGEAVGLAPSQRVVPPTAADACAPVQCRDQVLQVMTTLERAPSFQRQVVEAALGVSLLAEQKDSSDHEEFVGHFASGAFDEVRLRVPSAVLPNGVVLVMLQARRGVPLQRKDFPAATLGQTMRLSPGAGGLVSVDRVDGPTTSREFVFEGSAWKALIITRPPKTR